MPRRPEPARAPSLVLEPIGVRHRASMQRLLADPQVCRPLGYPWPFPATEAARIVARLVDARKLGRIFAFAIIADRDFVGACSLRRSDPAAGTAALGFWIGRPFWGRGHATAALTMLLDRSFEGRAAMALSARCLAGNGAAHRVLGKLGFAADDANVTDPQLRQFLLTQAQWRASIGTLRDTARPADGPARPSQRPPSSAAAATCGAGPAVYSERLRASGGFFAK